MPKPQSTPANNCSRSPTLATISRFAGPTSGCSDHVMLECFSRDQRLCLHRPSISCPHFADCQIPGKCAYFRAIRIGRMLHWYVMRVGPSRTSPSRHAGSAGSDGAAKFNASTSPSGLTKLNDRSCPGQHSRSSNLGRQLKNKSCANNRRNILCISRAIT